MNSHSRRANITHANRNENAMNALLKMLSGGDRRSIGKSEEVVALVLSQPTLFDQVFAGMQHADPLIRMRSADVVEKVTQQKPELLAPRKAMLIQHVARSEQQEVRWHVAQMFSRLNLNRSERAMVLQILITYLADKSRIVKTFAMQALADLAERDPALRPNIIKRLEQLTRTGSPAMQSRGKKLLAKLQNHSPLY